MLNPQLSTFNFQLSTLNLEPQTQNSEPWTLNPEPQTLYPLPFTQNPKTSNPKSTYEIFGGRGTPWQLELVAGPPEACRTFCPKP
jgi:hypothetical protein